MKQIGIVSVSPCAGAKTIAALLACYLAEREKKAPAVIELGTGGLYNSLGLDKRFAGKEFYAPGGPPNLLWGVNWQVQNETKALRREEYESTLCRCAGMIQAADGDILLCILNGLSWKEQKVLLESMNSVLLILDPMPSKLLSLPFEKADLYYFFFGKTSDLHRSPTGTGGMNRKKGIIPVINKMNKGVKRYQIENFLGISDPIEMPLLDVTSLYRAEYACKPPYAFKAVRETANDALCDLWNRLQ